MNFKDAKSFETIKKHFPKAHIEAVKGTPQQASDYCTKEDTRIGDVVIYGELPQQGKRNDLADIIDLLKDGMRPFDIMELYPSQYLLYQNKIEKTHIAILEEKYRTVFRHLEVYYLSDTSRAGKTRHVLEHYGYAACYRISNYKHPFDGYKGEDIVIFEEFRDSMPIEEMLQLLEGYPTRLRARYEDKVACYTKVYLISNWGFPNQYTYEQDNDSGTYEAFKKRFTFIGNLEAIQKHHALYDII